MRRVEPETPAVQPISPPPAAPAKWKLAVLAFVGLYPLVLLASWSVAHLLPSWPLPVRTALVIALVVPTMTWLVTPTVHRRTRHWLHR
ncbi:hypothetical protein GPX89_09005 [Nocardia sp. ET3-3]|uniref:Uncharacterized protein n=1 Tax=Nocardia terrae TaxID=2675851 RepID=A0A7K1USR7_9NOCA|nr:hypothetical protein [Nocardia terrae]MVU77384.1 hypothetical protein [Nocardia terrae]